MFSEKMSSKLFYRDSTQLEKISNNIREIFKVHDCFRLSVPVHTPPSTIHHHPSKQVADAAGTPEAGVLGLHLGTADPTLYFGFYFPLFPLFQKFRNFIYPGL